VTRAVLALTVCAVAIVVGLFTALLSSRNRARGGDLDERQHRCETLTRQIELQRARNAREEWLLVHGEPRPATFPPLRPPVEF